EQRADLGVVVPGVLGQLVRQVLDRRHPGHLDAELVQGGEDAEVEDDDLLRRGGQGGAALGVGHGHAAGGGGHVGPSFAAAGRERDQGGGEKRPEDRKSVV